MSSFSLSTITTGSPTSSPSILASALPSSQNDTSFRNTTVDMAAGNGTNDSSDRGFRLPPSTDFGPQINFTLWLLTALSAAFLALRIYCKFLRHRGLWWDDHLLIASWVSLFVVCHFRAASSARLLTCDSPRRSSPWSLIAPSSRPASTSASDGPSTSST